MLMDWMWIVRERRKDLDFQVFVLSSGKDGVGHLLRWNELEGTG